MTKSIFVVLFLVSCCSIALAQVPLTMSYQGYLTDNAGTPVPDGTYSIVFSLYTVEVGGIALWTETHPVVSVNKGLFNVTLGRGTPSNPLSAAFDVQYFLGIKVGADPEMAPRVRLSSVAYSLRSRTSDNLANPSVLTLGGDVTGPLTANSIAANAVTTPKIANDAVTTAKIANDAVTTPKIADNAVTTAKILPDIVSSLDGVSNDGGNIDLIAGANITITPDNAANTITIAAAGGGGLVLPYNGTVASALSAFKVENTGAGYGVEGRATTGVAVYARNNSDVSPALYVRNDANGNGINAGADGPGNVVNIVKNSGAGRSINILNNGTGSAIYVDGNTSGVGLELKQDGTGNAAYFHIDNAATSSNTLRATTASTNVNSDALEVSAKAGNALDAINDNATNPTIYANNSNASATSPVIKVGAVFTVDKSGTTTSKQYVATTNLGGGVPAAGGLYKDNVVCAWARVTGAGATVSSFGVSSITKLAVGTYQVNFSNAFASGNDVCATASARQSATNRFVMIGLYNAAYVTVEIYTNAGALVDNDFSVIVTGRQN